MVNYNRLKKENKKINEVSLAELYGWQYDLNRIAVDADRTAELAKYSDTLIEHIDLQFEKATKLNKTDVKFLLFATALQCIRQFIIGTITQRTDDKTAANKTKGHTKEHSDRQHRFYRPSLD